jgi:hypothetical protein
MTRIGLSDKPRTDPSPASPLVVRPLRARELLGGPSGNFFQYKILPQLESYCEGRSRWITIASIYRYIERRLAEQNPNARRRGRPPRKQLGQAEVAAQ